MTHLIINVVEIPLVDTKQLVSELYGSSYYFRLNLAGTKTILIWDEQEQPTPTFIPSLTTAEGPYLDLGIVPIILNGEWENQS
jgi:hypothetical protein